MYKGKNTLGLPFHYVCYYQFTNKHIQKLMSVIETVWFIGFMCVFKKNSWLYIKKSVARQKGVHISSDLRGLVKSPAFEPLTYHYIADSPIYLTYVVPWKLNYIKNSPCSM